MDHVDIRLTAYPAVASERWHLIKPDSTGWREWDGDVVVHVGCRADTHLLSPTAGAVLRTFLDSGEALTLQAAFERTFGDPQAPATPMGEAERDSMSAIVQGLERIGLLSRLPS